MFDQTPIPDFDAVPVIAKEPVTTLTPLDDVADAVGGDGIDFEGERVCSSAQLVGGVGVVLDTEELGPFLAKFAPGYQIKAPV